MAFTFLLTRGFHANLGPWHIAIHALGFDGIASGTVIAYLTGGVIQFAVLLSGRGGARLYLHRLRPHWITIKRIARIGLPAAVCDSLEWVANLAVIGVINGMDPTNASSAAHITVIRLESFSYLSGIAFGAAAATMVGISLGMRNPARAVRSALAAYIIGGGAMTLCGIVFITLGRYPAMWLAPADPNIVALTTRCLMITGFIQCGFAANLVFGGALRGAGDTLTVMLLNLASVITLRFTGVLYVGYHHLGLAAVWVCLSSELFIRGSLVTIRFVQGGWKRVIV
jgi:Na+-driven multidrug efflux pump